MNFIRRPFKSYLMVLAGMMLIPASSHSFGRGEFYPPADAAKSSIDFDNKGFIIKGQRAIIMSGSIHYPRVPHELWYDRLLRMKQGGFNNVQTYAFWNYNEPKENEWNFKGDGDIGEFLSTAQKLGLTATVRPGPYVCAEWDFGGFPVWLKFKGDMKVRTNDPKYLALNDHWYEKIIPIIAEHQINRGGNVILVQLENEHPRGWGVITDVSQVSSKNDAEKADFVSYFGHLHDEAVKLGLEVPHFMSGQNHGGNPSPGNINPDKVKFPWITTEFWSGWFDAYRTLANKKLIAIDQAQWTILGHGGSGYNFYMIHGGTNFESWSDDSTGASYDYGSAIGQAGDLRPMYYKMKRANQIGQSFPNILANASDALDACKDFAAGSGVSVLGARKSDAGLLVFLRNSKGSESTATFKSGETVKIPRHATYPIPQNVDLDGTTKIADATVPVLGVAKNEGVTTVIVYGEAGETGRLSLSANGDLKAGMTSPEIAESAANGRTDLKIKFPDQGVEQCEFDDAAGSIRVLAVNEDLSLYTWIIGDPGKQYVVCGPAFVRDLLETTDGISLAIERPYGQPSCGQVAVYGGKSKSWHLGVTADTTLDSQPAPTLSPWQMAATREQQPDFDDSSWLQSADPQQMGADGDYGCFAWYRASVDVPTAGGGTLHLRGADDVRVFVNGAYVSGDRNVTANFVAGKNNIAVLVAHHGRGKVFAYLGSLVHAGDKGLLDTVTLEISGRRLDVKGWRMRGGLAGNPAQITAWNPIGATQDLPVFYRSTFTAKPPGEVGPNPILRLKFAGLGRGTVWVNGHNLGQYPEKIRQDGLYIPECWLKDGENEVTIFDTHGADPSKVQLEVETPASREVIRVSQPIDPTTPMVTPQENPLVDLAAANKDNLAFQAVATASVSNGNNQPGNATDGNVDTIWSTPKDAINPSLQVDLGKSQPIKVCEIVWDRAAKNQKYDLEGSQDGQSWTELGSEATAVPTSPDSPSELSRLNLTGDSYRHLRVTCHNTGGVGIAEVRAFASAK